MARLRVEFEHAKQAAAEASRRRLHAAEEQSESLKEELIRTSAYARG